MDAIDQPHLYYGLDKWANGCRVREPRLVDVHHPGDARRLQGAPPPVFSDSPTNWRASFESVKIVHHDWKKAIIVRGKAMRPGRPPHEGVIAMASLKGSRTDQSLRHAFSGTGRLNRLSASSAQATAAAPVSPLRLRAGHLDFLIAGYDTSGRLGIKVAELATAGAAMTDDHIATRAGMARTAQDDGFEETVGWFATMAKAGRSHAGDMRRGLDNTR
jgi:hypothetical protein